MEKMFSLLSRPALVRVWFTLSFCWSDWLKLARDRWWWMDGSSNHLPSIISKQFLMYIYMSPPPNQRSTWIKSEWPLVNQRLAQGHVKHMDRRNRGVNHQPWDYRGPAPKHSCGTPWDIQLSLKTTPQIWHFILKKAARVTRVSLVSRCS